jgi:hypothetical protein
MTRFVETDFDMWSNIHFGYVGGSTGLSRGTLQWGAKKFGGVDDAADRISINVGVSLWNRHGNDLRPGHLQSAITQAIPRYEAAQASDAELTFLQPWGDGI